MLRTLSPIVLGLGAALLLAAPAVPFGRVENPVPVISSLSPHALMAGAPAQVIVIQGRNFLSTSTLTFNGASHKILFVNSGRIEITLSGADAAKPGNYEIVVANPPPGGGSSEPATFVVQPLSKVN